LEKDTAVSYCEISMATAPEGPYTVVTKKTLSTKYAVKNLEIGVKYYFRVRALETDSFAGSDYSNVASGYRKLVMGTLSVSMPCSGENILSWNPVEQAVGYEIWRGVYGVSGNMEKVAQTAETTFADTTADEETSYYYRLVALHQQPESNSALSGYIYALVDRRPEHDYGEWERVREPSVQASGEERRTCSTCGGVETRTLEALGLAAPVVKISGNTVTGKPKLSWEAVSGADFYRIYRAVGSTGSYSYYKSTRTTSFTDTSAVAGTNYYYKVKAVVEETDETSAYSNIVNRCCDLAKPVVTLKVDTASGKPKVTFEKISGAEKYYIVRSTSKTGTYSKLATITGTSYIDTSAKAGTNYYYKVKALHAKDAADSAYSDITNRVCDLAKPTVSISYNSTSGKPVVKWETVSGAAKYRVYRSTKKDSGYELVYTAVTARTYTDKTAKAGTNYYYKVKAVHTNSSADSAYSAIVNRMCDLAKPVISITRSNGDPKVSWETVEGAEKYEIWRATSKTGTYKKVKTAITARSFTDTSATAGKTYYYKVRAIHSNSAANSAYSAIKSIAAK